MTASPITGRCYCGAVSLCSAAWPQVVTYCHCSDCRRVTGAPVAAFAAFAEPDLNVVPAASIFARNGVTRWFCATCGSPLAARFDYLPGQVYVPLGLLDQAASLPSHLHSHADSALPWLHISDNLPRAPASARTDLQARANRNGPQ